MACKRSTRTRIKISKLCNKYIIIHIYNYQQSIETGFTTKEIMEGLWSAIADFLEVNKDFKIITD